MWVKERALFVNMYFLLDPSPFPLMPEPDPILQEDVDKHTDKIQELELDNTQLRVQLSQLSHTKQCNKSWKTWVSKSLRN